MIRYVSTRGGIKAVGFDEAVLSGFAADGGLFVPTEVPVFTETDLQVMAKFSYRELAAAILRKYIHPDIIPDRDLDSLIDISFENFSSPEIIPVTRLGKTNLYIQELFHGSTLSFKDIAMGFLVNCMDYFLEKRGERLSLILATTGDTGPAAAHAAAGKKTLDCWPLYPRDMISEEQERQMTTLGADNVHPVGVEGCTNGGDDLDIVVARLFSDPARKKDLKLSSVNSINWCRVMMQTVHYFHAYFQVAATVGEEIAFSVPTGAFGNLCAGWLAKAMGLPVKNFICATNENGTLHRVFQDATLSSQDLKQTVSSAIDIILPYNLWRFLYFHSDAETVKQLMEEFEENGVIHFDGDLHAKFHRGFLSASISDSETLQTMKRVYQKNNYLLDPHGAVAAAAAETLRDELSETDKIVCLATAHPAKFPEIVERALGNKRAHAASHPSIEEAKQHFQHLRTCRYDGLETALSIDIKRQLQRHNTDI